jgi:prepilin-type N-terminal cleavage/methylation domain-containing protein
MNRNHASRLRFQARGITLIEVLMVVSVLLIIAWFAIPSVGNLTARAEMTAAVENVRYSIDSARKLARRTESPVVLSVAYIPGHDGQEITLRRQQDDPSATVQNYRLPDEVAVQAAPETLTFDRRGLAEQSGRLLLVSKVDEHITEIITVD